ncbi:hypothetical protein B602_0317 [Chlamydia psittaci M56]|nr:hypothetical protein B602_0317 [Chlamydia psittaci M56]
MEEWQKEMAWDIENEKYQKPRKISRLLNFSLTSIKLGELF